MDPTESPIPDMSLGAEADSDIPELEQPEILPGFAPISCANCKKTKLRILGSLQDYIMSVCDDCWSLSFIRARPETIQVQTKRAIPLGVG